MLCKAQLIYEIMGSNWAPLTMRSPSMEAVAGGGGGYKGKWALMAHMSETIAARRAIQLTWKLDCMPHLQGLIESYSGPVNFLFL